jgi:hypothetical protein
MGEEEEGAVVRTDLDAEALLRGKRQPAEGEHPLSIAEQSRAAGTAS